jgi:hypothetical protein
VWMQAGASPAGLRATSRARAGPAFHRAKRLIELQIR